MDRRTFLRRSAQVGAAAAATPLLQLTPEQAEAEQTFLQSQRSVLEVPPSESGIDHVVVVMMENRSFDAYLGWLARDIRYMFTGWYRYGWWFNVAGNQFQTYLDGDGVAHKTQHFTTNAAGIDPYRGCGHPDPGHGWNAGRAQRDGGFVAPGSGNDDFALSYYNGDDLPFYRALAYRFTVCDHWHCSVLGPTFPNREYLLSGQSGGNKTNAFPPTSAGWPWDCIVDRLAAAGVSAIDYATDLPPLALFGSRMGPHIRTIADYYEDCATGSLPHVSFVDPAFAGGNRTDDHPHGDFRAAQRFVRDVFAAFARSKHWKRGLFVLLYDEWGGFFDHLAPPHFADERTSADDNEDFSQAGFRVPAILASPRARANFAGHSVFDHTSVLRFLEWRFLGAPAGGPGKDHHTWFLTPRDRNAKNIGRLLLADTSTPLITFDLDMPIPEPTPPCEDDGAAVARVAGTETEHSFATPEALEYFQSVGVKV
jgi:phospholipase C